MPGYHLVMGMVGAYQNTTTKIVGSMGFHLRMRTDPAILMPFGTYIIVSTREHDLSKMEVWKTDAHPSMLVFGGMFMRQDSSSTY